jgi:3,4-dihydroxy-2-butanone 4-phosphate synthase
MRTKIKFNTIPEVLSDLKRGKIVIVVDDADRENEGDLVVATDFATPADLESSSALWHQAISDLKRIIGA